MYKQDVILFLGKNTFLGRGFFRRYLLKLLDGLMIKSIDTFYKKIPFRFHLDNPTERRALFGNYNEEEIDFIKNITKESETVFIDIGANSGLYSCYIASTCGRNSIVIAIEPNPNMVERILYNHQIQDKYIRTKNTKFIIEQCAVSDDENISILDLSEGVGSASLHVSEKSDNKIEVKTKTLLSILHSNNIKKINTLKIDIEGYEDRALIPFFKNAEKTLYPKAIVIEYTSSDQWEVDILNFLIDIGYTELKKTRGNSLLLYSS